jgi:hypothetical protein
MIKEKYFSAKHDFHTATVAKSCFFISLILFAIALIEFAFQITILLEPGIFFALGILFLGIAGISWFFYSQFSKLSDIVSDIENGNIEP